jgi:predicted flavoprotein YhiN
MTPHFGAPIKAVQWRAGSLTSRGEAVLSPKGLEGGGIYPLSPAIRAGEALFLDLAPDLDRAKLLERMSAKPGKLSIPRVLRNVLRLPPVKIALFNECAPRTPMSAQDVAGQIKALRIRHAGLRPLDEAISTTGGVPWGALDESLMLRDRPGVFCAGEMIDWDAPTGGYLLTACMATGLWAGRHAADWVSARS